MRNELQTKPFLKQIDTLEIFRIFATMLNATLSRLTSDVGDATKLGGNQRSGS
jgi:hypothetical protein